MAQVEHLEYELFHPGDLEKTGFFLILQQKIDRFKPDIILVFEAKSAAEYNSDSIVNELTRSIRTISFLGIDGSIPMARRILKQKQQRVFVIAPFQLDYFLLINGPLHGQELPGVDENGRLLSSAHWVLDRNLDSGMLTEFLKDTIGYAQPYLDALGKGKRLLQNFFAALEGTNYPYLAHFAEERVERAMQLAKHPARCILKTASGELAVSVNAQGFGIFHTGTLIASLKKLYPEASAVAITSDQQEKVFSLALFDHFHRLSAEGEIRKTWNRMTKQKGAQVPSDYLVRVAAKERPGFPF